MLKTCLLIYKLCLKLIVTHVYIVDYTCALINIMKVGVITNHAIWINDHSVL